MFSLDFWRMFIALWLEGFIFILIIKEQERTRLIPYQREIEVRVRGELNKILNSENIISIRKQIIEQAEKLNTIKEKVEEILDASNTSRR